MTLAEKLAGGFVAIAMITTLILPDRQTVPVIGATFGGLSQTFKTVMGR